MAERLTVYRVNGYEVSVELSNDINKYALDFLHIFNNVKEQDGLIRIWSNYGNRVYVVSDEETHEALVKYLSQFGEIKSDNLVQIMKVDSWASNLNYDLDKYDELILDPVLD